MHALTHRFWSRVLVVSALLLPACGSDDPSSPTPTPPLEITARTPAPSATGVETAATVTVTFNQAINPGTLTAATLLVKVSGVALPVALTYDAATRTARAVAPLLPGRTYVVEVTPGLRTPADSALPAADTSGFATRAWQTVLVDLAPLTGYYSSLVLDGTGLPRVAHYDATDGDLEYTACIRDCTTPPGVNDSWLETTVDATAFVGFYSSLALQAGGQLHVSYHDGTNGDLKYAACAAACHNSVSSWQTVTLDSTGNTGMYTSLAVDAGGRLHLSYYLATGGNLKYGTCAAACTTVANWQTVAVDTAGQVGFHTSLKVDGNGRVHVSYYDVTNGNLKYATCAAACATAGAWQTVTLDATGNVGEYTSLAVEGGGRLHVSYFDVTNADLKYATCSASCAMMSNWQTATVDATGLVGRYNSLAVDGGRVHVSYFNDTNDDLEYATCATGCATAANWRAVTVDGVGSIGIFTSLAVGATGRLHVSYHDIGNGALKYIE